MMENRQFLKLALILASSLTCLADLWANDPLSNLSVEKEQRYQAQWKLSFGGSSYDSPTESSQIAQSAIKGLISYQLTPSLYTKTEVSANLGTGRVQSHFGDFKPSNSISLSEAYLSWAPFKFFSMRSGAINQKHLNSPLLVSSKAFPALVERLKWKTPSLFAELRLQQAIPSSSTLSTKAVTKEPTPTFYTESLIIGAKITSRIVAQGFLTHYKFSQLPNTVIEQSSIYGNSINFIGPNSPRNYFIYKFDGLLYGGYLRANLTRSLKLKIGGYILENQKAPTSYRLGREIFTEIKFNGKSQVYSLMVSSFFNESDTSPGFYNSSSHGHNNRNGYSVALGLQLNNYDFKVAGGYSKSGLINPSNIQEAQSHYFINLETLYEKL